MAIILTLAAARYLHSISRSVIDARDRIKREHNETPVEVRFSYKDFALIERTIGVEIRVLGGLRVVPDDRVPNGQCFVATEKVPYVPEEWGQI